MTTHFQATLIIILLSVIAFCVGTFLMQDWYYSFRAWRQKRAMDRAAQMEWERKHSCPHQKEGI